MFATFPLKSILIDFPTYFDELFTLCLHLSKSVLANDFTLCHTISGLKDSIVITYIVMT